MPRTEVAMTSRPTWRVLALLAALAAGLALTTTAQAAAPAGKAAGAKIMLAGSALATPDAAAKRVFRPRIGPALGIVPALTFRGGPLQQARRASQPLTPLTYHGGQTMTGRVTVHTIFWTGGTNPFQGRPPGAPHDYTGMVEQYLTDVADASTGTSGQACTTVHCNVFTVQSQFGWGTTPGGITHGAYTIRHVPGDMMIDTQSYPSKSAQCASPNNTAVCVTDAQVQAEVNR